MKKLNSKFLFTLSILYSFILTGLPDPCRCQDDDRDSWQKPEKVMDAIGVKPGMIIGEAGAGSGYFTFKLAKRVGDTGKIYANDISQWALNRLKNRCEREKVENIEIIHKLTKWE